MAMSLAAMGNRKGADTTTRPRNHGLGAGGASPRRGQRRHGVVGVLVLYLLAMADAQASALATFNSAIGLLKLAIGLSVLGYAAIITVIAIRKHRETQQLLLRLAREDSSWQHDALKRRIEITFERVHLAWRHRNPELDRAYVSEKLHALRRLQIDQMRRDGVINRMENARLVRARIVEVLDYANDARDSFRALIQGDRADYTVHAHSGKVLGGQRVPVRFRELWTFRREPEGWRLDDIDTDPTISDLQETRIFSESTPRGADQQR